MSNYGTVIKGGLDTWTVVLTDASGWPAGSNLWVWKMLIGKRETRTALELAITSTSSVITTVAAANDTMTLVFDLTGVSSDTLEAGSYYVEIEGLDVLNEYYYESVHGELTVREPEGGG